MVEFLKSTEKWPPHTPQRQLQTAGADPVPPSRQLFGRFHQFQRGAGIPGFCHGNTLNLVAITYKVLKLLL